MGCHTHLMINCNICPESLDTKRENRPEYGIISLEELVIMAKNGGWKISKDRHSAFCPAHAKEYKGGGA